MYKSLASEAFISDVCDSKNIYQHGCSCITHHIHVALKNIVQCFQMFADCSMKKDVLKITTTWMPQKWLGNSQNMFLCGQGNQ